MRKFCVTSAIVVTLAAVTLSTFTGCGNSSARETRNKNLALVEQSLQQFENAKIAASHYRETSDLMFAEQVSEYIEKANGFLTKMPLRPHSNFMFHNEVVNNLTMNVYHCFDFQFRFYVQCCEAERDNEAEWQKEGWEALLTLLDNFEQLSPENHDLAEIQQIREETFQLSLRYRDLDSPNSELADEFLRDFEQRCQKSIDWFEGLRERSATEEMKQTISDTIDRHKWLRGMTQQFARIYAGHRKRWESLDDLVIKTEAIGDELLQSRNP
jgi:hypothetical protein